MVITGVIRPPPEIRAVADRTASYVAKNGRTFEARILNSAKGKTPKFAFLQPTSPFHAYYEDRIKFYEEGGEDVEEKKAEESTQQLQQQHKSQAQDSATTAKETTTTTTRKTQKTQVASAIDPVAKALLDQRAKIAQARAKQKEEAEAKQAEDTTQQQQQESSLAKIATTLSNWQIPAPPPLDLVAIVAPTGLSTSQIEVMQLVAQFAALDGKGGIFLHQLSMREWTNTDFAFCQPRHAHFPFFSALVDAYRRIITDWIATASEKPNSEPNDQDQAKDNKEKDKAKQIQSVLEEAAYRAEYERDREQQRTQHEDGEVVAIDWHSFVVVETIDFPVDEKVELSMLPPPPPPPPPPRAASTTATTQSQAAGAQEPTMDESDADDDDEEDEAIRVVPSYTPKVVGTANPQATRAIDPITGKSVPVSDVPEHLRIQLLDPRWAEERKKFQDKQKESNLVAGDAIVNNLTRFSQARGDLFGKSDQERLDKEKDSKRRLEEANRIIREQGNQPPPGFPSLSTVGTVGAGPHNTMEPEAKRLKMDYNDVINIPPPPPPPPRQPIVIPPPPPPPPTTATGPSTAMEPSGIPMADALLLASNNANTETPTSQLIPEAEFAASLSKPEVTLQIRIPNDPTQMAWNFYGQILSLQVNVMSTIKKVKEDLSHMHLNGMPINKIQLKDPNAGFYNNNNATLAALNIGPTATLEMAPKIRGGRR